MSRRKINTTTKQLIDLVQNMSDPLAASKLIKIVEKTIPVIKRRKNMPKIDPYLNKKLRIKRINYNAIVKIINFDQQFYTANIIAIESVNDIIPKIQVGDTLLISPRELQLTSRPA